MKKLFLALSIATLFTGCASVMNETSQGIKLEAKTADGKLVTGAECQMINDYGTVKGKSGETLSVHRSNVDLRVYCVDAQNGEAKGIAVSRVNGGMFGNILLGGGIGALVDHNRGTAYTYPTWIQVVFGKFLNFDRAAEKTNEPVAPINWPTTAAIAK